MTFKQRVLYSWIQLIKGPAAEEAPSVIFQGEGPTANLSLGERPSHSKG